MDVETQITSRETRVLGITLDTARARPSRVMEYMESKYITDQSKNQITQGILFKKNNASEA